MDPKKSYICLWHNGMLWVILQFKSLGNPRESKGIAVFSSENHWNCTPKEAAICHPWCRRPWRWNKAPQLLSRTNSSKKKWCVLTESLEIGHLQASNMFLGWRWWLTYEIIHVYAKKKSIKIYVIILFLGVDDFDPYPQAKRTQWIWYDALYHLWIMVNHDKSIRRE